MTELLKNPRMLQRVQEEIDHVVGKDLRLEESDLSKLPYLQAIWNETFRRHPVVLLSNQRVSTVDSEANGYHIPKDSRLLINTWAIGRDPSVWEDPLEFKPERFLEGKSSRVNPGGTYFELIRFGAGRRICAGLRMGVVMVQLILGTLVHSFDWRVQDGAEVKLDEAFGLVLGKADRIQLLA